MDVLQWSRHYRCFPGQGGFDLAVVPGARARGRVRRAALARGLQRRLPPGRPGAAWPSTRCARCCCSRRRRAPPSCRAAAPLRGYAFVELAVAPERASTVERLLIAMGFRHAGHHRTKAVQLWRHGDTHILVNHEGHAEPGPRVAAIAVESAEPIRSARRAEQLLAPLLPRDRGPDEADLSAIAAPDGTSVFFCRTDAADAESWLADFLTAGPPGPGAAAEVAGIDHVALSQPFDYFDEAALFYRSVLGLELQSGHELAAPDGLVRSRAARSADGSVRLRAQRAARGQRRLGAPARRARLRGHLRRRARDARPRRAAARDPRQLLRRPRRADGPRPGADRPHARARRPLRRRRAASSCTSTPR